MYTSIKKNFIISNALLFLIFILALIFRFYHLSSLPFFFHHDEVINTYVGRFILLHGYDIRGNPWPLFYFDKFGDFPPVFPMYLSGLATFVFGVNEFASRFPSALIGSLSVIGVYLLARALFKNMVIALLSAFFLAILPWHIVLSRASAEVVMGLGFFIVAIFLLLQGIQGKKKVFIVVSCLLFLASYLFYPSFRLLSPLVVVPFFFLFTSKKQRMLTCIVLSVLLIATCSVASTHWGRARLSQTSIFSNQDVILRVQALQRDEGQNAVLEARVFNNKAIGYSREFIRQYLSYFSPDFLFSTAGLPYNYQVPDNGLLYFIFILFLLGILLHNSQSYEEKKYFYFTLYLLIIAPIPAALTSDFIPNIHRSLFMAVPFVILIAYGAANIVGLLKKKRMILTTFIIFSSLALIFETTYFVHSYSKHLGLYNSLFSDSGNKEITQYLLKNKNNYSKIISTNGENLPLYYLFYSNDFSIQYVKKDQKTPVGQLLTKAGNIFYMNDECPSEKIMLSQISGKELVIDGGDCKDTPGFNQIGGIMRKDGTNAFKMLVPIQQ